MFFVAPVKEPNNNETLYQQNQTVGYPTGYYPPMNTAPGVQGAVGTGIVDPSLGAGAIPYPNYATPGYNGAYAPNNYRTNVSPYTQQGYGQ
jgi:hypothetical protein